jgi:hypothetical protein
MYHYHIVLTSSRRTSLKRRKRTPHPTGEQGVPRTSPPCESYRLHYYYMRSINIRYSHTVHFSVSLPENTEVILSHTHLTVRLLHLTTLNAPIMARVPMVRATYGFILLDSVLLKSITFLLFSLFINLKFQKSAQTKRLTLK